MTLRNLAMKWARVNLAASNYVELKAFSSGRGKNVWGME